MRLDEPCTANLELIQRDVIDPHSHQGFHTCREFRAPQINIIAPDFHTDRDVLGSPEMQLLCQMSKKKAITDNIPPVGRNSADVRLVSNKRASVNLETPARSPRGSINYLGAFTMPLATNVNNRIKEYAVYIFSTYKLDASTAKYAHRISRCPYHDMTGFHWISSRIG